MKSICVFCGSSAGNDPSYKNAALQTGKLLAENKITLVYGGGKVGLMGAIADEVLKYGGEVIGVIPQFLVDKEVAHQQINEMIVVQSMHERKQKMSELADGFMTLPGGIGTFEEFYEVLTWGQLNLHQKPIGLLNAGGYYDLMLQFLDHSMKTGFLRTQSWELVLTSSEPEELLNKMKQAAMIKNLDVFDSNKT